MPARFRLPALILAALLPGCVGVPAPVPAPAPPPDVAAYIAVAERIEPVAEARCRATPGAERCDFTLALAPDPALPPNAFQTVDGRGRPIVVVTRALLLAARNPDELAFVLGHEAAHHIAGHIPRRHDQARTGAILAGLAARAAGLAPADIRAAEDEAAALAARQYSRAFELEADALGAAIAFAAGFDPRRGAAFFARLPDPGEGGAAGHPSTAARRAAVEQAMLALEAAAAAAP